MTRKKTGALRVTWVTSAIGCPLDQKRTIRALGFRRLGQVIEKPDSPAVRGMLRQVRHLVKVEES